MRWHLLCQAELGPTAGPRPLTRQPCGESVACLQTAIPEKLGTGPGSFLHRVQQRQAECLPPALWALEVGHTCSVDLSWAHRPPGHLNPGGLIYTQICTCRPTYVHACTTGVQRRTDLRL